ncbi:MAG: Molybdopterin-guanine dinucleotide biosynthesis protein [Bacteroidetes bacterium]|nr:Molybdopterin-guanine dinucleotide biosynthesis protein [Bacteroidota bacterium]
MALGAPTRKKREDIAGAILAGGKSTRMGRDKAMLDLLGKTFIQRIAETLQAVFGDVVVVSAWRERYSFLDLPIIKDIYKNCGPLGGIHAALSTTEAPAVFFCSCDVPFVSPEIVHYVVNRRFLDQVTLLLGSNSLQPLFGVYKQSCLPVIEKQLKHGQYSVQRCIFQLTTTILSEPSRYREAYVNPLMNINTPFDYEQCLRMLEDRRTRTGIMPQTI